MLHSEGWTARVDIGAGRDYLAAVARHFAGCAALRRFESTMDSHPRPATVWTADAAPMEASSVRKSPAACGVNESGLTPIG
jgi:hypothetical protein